MASLRTHDRRISHGMVPDELERRIAQTRQQLKLARSQFHTACMALTAAERELLALRVAREEAALHVALRVAREEAALHVARLADVLESLENSLCAEQEKQQAVPVALRRRARSITLSPRRPL